MNAEPGAGEKITEKLSNDQDVEKTEQLTSESLERKSKSIFRFNEKCTFPTSGR